MFSRLLLFVLLLAGAGSAAAQTRVVASLPAVGAIAREVLGAEGTVTVLAPPTQDPHFVDGKPTMMLALNKADLLLDVGLGLEQGWLPPLVTGARNPRIQPGQPGNLDVMSLVQRPLEVPASLDRSLGDVHAGGNPHFWYDPRRVQEVATGIAERLAALDPGKAATFRKNAAAFRKRLDAKIAAWEKEMAPFRGRSLVPFHKSLVYLEDWLGLRELATVEPLPGISPSPSHLAGLILRMRKVQPPPVVVAEPWYNQSTARTVAEKAGAQLVTLPGDVGGTPDTGDYVAWMEMVLARLRTGLEEAK
ncbi:metal ABC transporter substrate-binding protein [Vulgatibacter sp.]|uniref:metal ABC transporter substrate-binding protein n=1 Tax=Vulgatibacter sp. TaxID=1971226 RepID=UPI0035661366